MQLWADKIRSIEPYTPGEQPEAPNIIKINTNENPYPPSSRVDEAMKALESSNLKLYPDPTSDLLITELARYYNVDKSRVFAGVGSDDVLAVAFMTFFNSDKPILFPDITYSFYPVWADLFKVPFETRPLTDDFKINREDYYGENGGIIFPNPNAPTSYYEKLDLVEDILKHNQDVIVIVDEAYIDFAGESALSLIDKYDNLIVVQTFSKSRSMAGIRIGYAIGNPVLIKAMNDVKYSYNSYTMNLPSLVCGAESVKDDEYFRQNIEKIKATREWTRQALTELGFEFPEPGGNFIFARHSSRKGVELFEALKKKQIYVRYFNKPRISDYLRITIGTDNEMKVFIEALKEIL